MQIDLNELSKKSFYDLFQCNRKLFTSPEWKGQREKLEKEFESNFQTNPLKLDAFDTMYMLKLLLAIIYFKGYNINNYIKMTTKDE